MSADCKQSRNTAGWSRSSLNRNVLAAKGGKIHMSAFKKKNGIFFYGNRFYTSICKKETRKRGLFKKFLNFFIRGLDIFTSYNYKSKNLHFF